MVESAESTAWLSRVPASSTAPRGHSRELTSGDSARLRGHAPTLLSLWRHVSRLQQSPDLSRRDADSPPELHVAKSPLSDPGTDRRLRQIEFGCSLLDRSGMSIAIHYHGQSPVFTNIDRK